ncbi:hypothetical protein [Polycladidibacter hongkongensis]|uniref:hypothetical protein n=1 Tax=Polycladidibacter hongkongensis TaxID=1647556 RepID=UPI000B1B9720|nr:hypothetical protein [Pseudovibrio hongkongensis]
MRALSPATRAEEIVTAFVGPCAYENVGAATTDIVSASSTTPKNHVDQLQIFLTLFVTKSPEPAQDTAKYEL